MRKLLLFITLIIPITVNAQELDPVQQMPEIDATDDYIVSARNFSFPFSRLRFQGLDARYNLLRINSMQLNSNLNPNIPWTAIGHTTSIGNESGESLILLPFELQEGGTASIGASNRTYSYRASATYNILLPRGWAIAASATRRWGRSMSIDGIFVDNTSAYIGIQKRWDDNSTIAINAIFAPTIRSYASPISAEAASLVGNNLYNPAWGYWDGKQRPTNIRTTTEPIITLNYNATLSPTLTLATGAMVRFGTNSRTALNWQGAPNPTPDYYKYLPSAQSDPAAAAELANLWRSSPSISQINFNALQNINVTNGSRANYIIENRVNKPLDLTVKTALNGENFAVGGLFRYEYNHAYKTVADLLNADYWLDIDSFVEQDEDVKLKTQNNLRDPNRHVRVGDTFGYNYALTSMTGKLYGSYYTSIGRWKLYATGYTSILTFQRQGFYEKENFPSGRSYGASQAAVFGEFGVNLGATYRVGSLFDISMSAAYDSKAPTVGDILPDARYRNFINNDVVNENALSFDVKANYRTDKIKAHIALHHISITNGITTRQMYDDIASTYIIYAMRNVNRRYMGLDASVEIKLYDALSLNAALFLQNNIYTSNPIATAYNQNNGNVIRRDEIVDYTGLRTPFSPQTAGVIALSYRPYGWTMQLSLAMTDHNYVDPSPLRRTALQRQYLNEVTTQEKLPLALSLDIFGGYNFYFKKSSLGIYASINNILNNTNIRSTGYESTRITRIGNDYPLRYNPQSSKYYYALPLNFSINVTYRF